MAEMRGDSTALNNIKTMELPKNAVNTRKQVEFLADQMTAMRQRPTKQDTVISRQSPANLFPNTILQTSDMSVVKDKVNELLAQIEDKEDGKQVYFEDADFGPTSPGNMTTIYRPQDIISKEEKEQMDILKWLRPRQISMKSDLVGFTEINKDGVLETELDNLVGMELADFRRISYGDILENRWFLNAASLVA